MTNPATVELHPTFYTMMGRAAGLMPAGMKGFFTLSKMLFEDFLCWFTLPVEVFIRRRIGVRAISLFKVLPLVLGALAFAFLLRGITFDPLFALFLLGAAGFAVYHFRESRAWEVGGGPWRHTYSNGDPLPVWERLAPLFERAGLDAEKHLTPAKVIRFYEPALCFVVGVPLWLLVSKLLGVFLVGAAVALLFKAHIRHARFVDLIRDRNDTMLTGQLLAEMPNRSGQTGQARVFVAVVAVRAPLPIPGSAPALPPPLPAAEPTEKSRVQVECHGCRATLRVKPGAAGRKAPCPKCRATIRVPLGVAG